MQVRWPHRATAVAVMLFVLGAWAGDRTRAQQAGTGAAYPEAMFGGLKWRSIGPDRGGRSIAVAGSAARALEYYFGATGGGLWKTTDGGTTWGPAADKFLKTSSVGAVAVAESNPDVVYVGTGETELRGNIIQGDGAYKTSDGGKTWSHVGLPESRAIARIRVHPKNPDLVYAAVLGDPYAPTEQRGVYRSRDGGKTWDRVLFRDTKTGAVDLSMDPNAPDTLYAALWEVFRTPHSLSSGGPGSGLFKSTDGGATWTELTTNPGLPAGLWGKVGVSVSPVDGKRVYAIVENADGGVFASDDGGATWKRANDERRLRQRAFYYTRIYADTKDRDTVYVLNTGFYRSTDGGKTYKSFRVPHGDNHDLWIAPDDSKRMINGNDGGANVSVNGGESWTGQDYPTAQFYNAFVTAHVPYHVCGAQQDNSTACVSSAGGRDLYAVGGGESGYIAPDPRNPDVFYAGSYGGDLTRFDRRTGVTRAINVWPDNPMGYSAKDITERFQWTYPIVFSPADPGVLYVGSQHVWKTTDDGQSWERISPDLTRHDPSTMGPSGGPITLDQTGVETYATVFTIAPSPRDGRTIWAGSDDGLIHVTRDGGKTWDNVTPTDLPEFARISLIEASPHKAATAYVAANRYQRADRAPYVYRTDDYGRTWTKIVGGLPATDFARAIREDREKAGLLYLGTEQGIYVSFDNGGSWQSLRLDLPVTPVHGIVSTEKDLVIGTHGRSFYILDNAAVLRQFTPGIAEEPVHLFDPPDARRSVDRGVAVDYYLKSPAEKVTIDILDAKGQLVNSYSGVLAKEGDKPAGPPSEEEFFRPRAAPVPVKAGMNRFVWDMRYAGAKDFPNMILWAGSTRGPLAPPGTYQVRLTAAGETQTQSFAIARNPNTPDVTDADLAEQFALALQIRDKVTQANEAVIRIRSVKDQVADRVKQWEAGQKDKKASKAAQLGEALTAKLTAIEGEIYQYRNRSSQDPLNYPIKLNNKLAALQGVVEGGDGKPTQQSYAVFKELSGRLDAELAKLDAALKSDLPPFNTEIAKKKLKPVAAGPEFPPELVSFGPPSAAPLLAGTGGDTWDRNMRERGWIMREGGTWHLWYTGYNDAKSDSRFLGYATSPDGLAWARWPGNPLTTGGWVEDVCVVKRGDTYYMFAEGRDDIAHLLTSTDRVHWKEQGDLDIRQVDGRPISAGPRGTPAVWLENGTWWLFYERADLAVFAATSKDLKVWTNVTDEPVLARGPEAYDRYAVAVDQIIRHGDRYYAYYHASALKDWGEWSTCLAVSDDLVHWTKYPGNPVLPVNPSMKGASSGMVVHDGTQFRLYTTHPNVRVYFPLAQ